MTKTSEDEKTTSSEKDGKAPAPAPAPRVKAAPATPMFGSFTEAKKRKVPRWAAPLLIGAALLHAVMFVSMWIKTIWEIEQLDPPKTKVNLALAPSPPPQAPPPATGQKQKPQELVKKKIKVRDIVQPMKIEKDVVAVDQINPNAIEGEGEGEGVDPVGIPEGVLKPAEMPVAKEVPKPPEAPKTVPPTMVEGLRVAGEKNIVPDDVTKTEIQRSGKDKLVGSFKLCLSLTGDITTINQLKSTGFSSYDSKIQREMRTWRYRPYMVNGKAVPVCTAVTFIYSQR